MLSSRLTNFFFSLFFSSTFIQQHLTTTDNDDMENEHRASVHSQNSFEAAENIEEEDTVSHLLDPPVLRQNTLFAFPNHRALSSSLIASLYSSVGRQCAGRVAKQHFQG